MGWHDYAMRQMEARRAAVTPIEARGAEDELQRGRGGGGDAGALGAEDYAANGLIWQMDDDTPQVAVWSDATHLDWGQPAEEIAAEMASRLRAQTEAVAGLCRRVVGVTHFVPFAELAQYRLRSPRRAYAKAFLGSPLLGEALVAADGLELVIYGHRHRQEVREVRGVVTADAGVTGDDGPLLLTLPD